MSSRALFFVQSSVLSTPSSLLSLMMMVMSFVVLSLSSTMAGQVINLGMLSPFKHVRLSWETNAAAATMALDRAKREGLLPAIDVRIHWEDDECTALGGAGKSVILRYNYSVDAFIGPPCSSATTPAGLLASSWNLPMFTPGSSDPSLADKTTFSTLVRLGPPFNRMGSAFVEVFRYFGWTTVVIVSRRKTDNKNVFCDFSSRAAEETFRENNITVADSIIIGDDPSIEEIDELLSRLRQRGRIIILCTEMTSTRRRILLRAHSAGMFDGNYVIFMPEQLLPPNVETPWAIGDPDDDVIKEAYEHVFQITVAEMAGKGVEQFRDEIPLRMADPPWNYNATLLAGKRGSQYSPFLHDVVYLYLVVLNETLTEGRDHRDGRLLFSKATNRTFRGVTGNVKLDGNGDRLPDYWLWRMSRDLDVFTVTMEARMTSEDSQKVFVRHPIIWATKDGKVPPDTPLCGFFGELCPPDRTVLAVAITVAAVILIIVIALSVAGFFYRRRIMLEKDLLLMLWKIDYDDIQLTKRSCVGSISQMSFTSALNMSLTRSSMALSLESGGFGENQLYSAVALYKGQLVAVKKLPDTKVTIDRSKQLHLKMLKELNHENVLCFVGLCLDERYPCMLTAYCAKGSLQDIIENDDITLDWTFKVSLATDLVHGMNFLHNSPLRYHGRLKSSNCLVDNRWTLKVAEFGLHSFFPPSQANHGSDDCRRCKSLLWTAPEVLRNSVDTVPKMSELDLKRADVYSFSIVLFEILFRSYPYDTDLMTPTEIITRIKQGENPLLRPLVPIGGTGTGTGSGHNGPEDVPAIVLKLMQKGWSECPLDRPLFPSIKTRFAALTKGRRTGIVDNMLALLEKYANNLEDIVETRTRELVDERKKSDMLLYRMLPRVVAEKLKNGQTVPAELYEGVTVFFSDIVGFTSLASASSPFEIVDLLNDLYTNFDSILSQHDVYKVETIGDAYMVVSGVPERNENRHVSEIANVALDFLSSIGSFRVMHRPGMQLSLRIGIHTGPCAAGVVGQTMPRYCLFGNTVNVASRMESTGSALKIQVSEETKTKLDDIGGYMLAHRGTIDVKGKGAQDTYWLEGKKDYSKSLPRIDSNATPLED